MVDFSDMVGIILGTFIVDGEDLIGRGDGTEILISSILTATIPGDGAMTLMYTITRTGIVFIEETWTGQEEQVQVLKRLTETPIEEDQIQITWILEQFQLDQIELRITEELRENLFVILMITILEVGPAQANPGGQILAEGIIQIQIQLWILQAELNLEDQDLVRTKTVIVQVELKIILDLLEVRIVTITDLLIDLQVIEVTIARGREVLLQEVQQWGLQAAHREAAVLEEVLHPEEDQTINKTKF